MSEQYIPGDVVIKTVSLYADSGVVNATELVRYLSVYESILTPGIIVKLRLDDTRDLLASLSLVGGEKVVVEFQTPGREVRRIDGVIGSVVDADPTDNMRSKSYTLEIVSEEVLTDKTVQVTKSYNTNISNMVDDIAKHYLKTTKTVSVQLTKGVQKIIIPSKRPFEAIKMLRSRSFSVDDKSSSYVFFENNVGFHYKTIEKLMTDGDVGDRVFTNDETIRHDVTKSSFRNIIAYTQPDQFDLVNRAKTGGINHQVNKFDIRTLTYTSVNSKFNPSDFKSADGTMKPVDNSRTTSRFTKAGSSSWVIHDSGKPDTFISDGLGARKNMASLLGQGFLHLHVFGDSELSAGQLMDLNIMQNVTSDTVGLHPQLSGKYVVAFIHHVILSEGNNPRYTCSIEALKGGYK